MDSYCPPISDCAFALSHRSCLLLFFKSLITTGNQTTVHFHQNLSKQKRNRQYPPPAQPRRSKLAVRTDKIRKAELVAPSSKIAIFLSLRSYPALVSPVIPSRLTYGRRADLVNDSSHSKATKSMLPFFEPLSSSEV